MRIEVTLPPLGRIKRSISGRYVIVRQADGEIEISSPGSKIEPVIMENGDYHDLGSDLRGPFEVVNMTTSNNTVVIDVNARPVVRGNSQNLSLNTTTTVENSNNNIALPEVSVGAGLKVQIAAANGNRKELRVSIKSDQVGGVYLGGNTAADGVGGYLEEGVTDYIETEGALYAYNPNTSAVVVNMMDLERL